MDQIFMELGRFNEITTNRFKIHKRKQAVNYIQEKKNPIDKECWEAIAWEVSYSTNAPLHFTGQSIKIIISDWCR